LPPVAPLLESRVKSNHELQTVREMVGSKKSEWGATRIWHGRTPLETLPAMAQPFFLFSIFAGMVPPFFPFLLAILETYGIQVIHLHPKSVALLAVFAYTCEAWIGIKPSVSYFCHLFSLRPSGLNQSSGCISFITTTGTKGDFIDLKWMKKVEDFRSRWLFIDILKESEFFLITRVPPVKLTTWASEALPEEALKTLRPRICDLWKSGVMGTMVGVEFVTMRIAPLQDHHRSIWAHRAGDDLRLHVSELNADAQEEVIRAFFSSTSISTISRGALPIFSLSAQETSRVTAGILKFNAWGTFLADGVTPDPLPSAPAASLEQDSAARGVGTEASEDLDGDGAESGERVARRKRSESTMVLSDSSDDDECALLDQPTGGDTDASSSRDLEEEGRLARLEEECRSKFNAERASRRPEMGTPHGKGPADESSAPPPPTSALPGKRGWVERDAS
jgi:hypothetical protein